MDAFEREENNLQEQLDCGAISVQEYNREMRELQRDYQAAAQEAAQEAFDREYERW